MSVRLAEVEIQGVVQLSQGRYHNTPRLRDELPDAYEQRTWRERMHVTTDGHVFVPSMAFKNGLSEACKFKPMTLKGAGKTTWTKYFESGILVTDPLILPVLATDVAGISYFVPADGRRGSGKRVVKIFPEIMPPWGGIVRFYVSDDIVTEDIFSTYVEILGKFIGLGRFRPRNNGHYGRFDIKQIKWSKWGT